MWLKEDGGGALNSGNVYLRNRGDYITSKPWVGEEVIAATLSTPESFPMSSLADRLVTMGSREGPSAMKHRMGSAAVSSWKRLKVAGKMRRHEREVMGWDVLSSANFIGIAGDGVMIHFLRKRGISVSVTHTIWMWSRGAKRWGV
jgi:hypothetical protein